MSFVTFGLIGLVVAMSPKTIAEKSVAYGLVLGVGFLAAAMLLDNLRFRLRIWAEGIAHRSAWRKCRFIGWQDVDKLSYKADGRAFVIYSLDGRRIVIPSLLSGTPTFLAECERWLPPEKLWPAQMGYIALSRPMPGATRG